MPAIIRQTMGRNLARDLLAEITESSNEYYIGIGKSDAFNEEDTVITPTDSILEETEFRRNLQSIKKVEGATFVVKRYNWSSGSLYSGWDDAVGSDTQYPYYVLNDAKELYICLETGLAQDGSSNVSTIEPNYGALNVDYTQPFRTGDGYVWKFLFSLTPERIYSYLSSNYIPVDQAQDSLAGGDAIEDLQFMVKDTAIGGEIIRADIVNGGSGFTTAPTITVLGDGFDAQATAYITDGVITKIEMTDYGYDYTYATLRVEGDGVDAQLRSVITSSDGIGFDPINDLRTSSILMNIKPNGTEDDTFIVENSFRQIGVIKNPLTPALIGFTGTSAKVLPSLTLTASSPFEVGKKIVGAQSNAVAYVNESVGDVVYYHQNESTGMIPFLDGEALAQEGVVLTGTIDSQSKKNGIDRSTGDVLYIENRHRIRRDAEQQEDIKVVIEV